MYGPIITGIFGTTLHMIDRKILQLRHVGGVILFSQNFSSKPQVTELITQIQAVRKKYNLAPALILIDHEGGTVQRLTGEHFTQLPSAAHLGQIYQNEPQKAIELIRDCALITAYELHSVGINVCLGPVLDLFATNNKEEHSRFYSDEEWVIVALTAEFNQVMHQQGILTVAKHFPGIGYSKTNTHFSVSISEAELNTLLARDLVPYQKLQQQNLLPAIMTAHRVFINIDKKPICTSKKWIQELLREQFEYKGLTFTDCVQMGGASIMGGNLQEKIFNSLAAGCDFVLSSQTPFDSYTQLYKALNSPQLDQLLDANSGREQRINEIITYSGHFKGTEYEYLQAQKRINARLSNSLPAGENPLTRTKIVPRLYKLQKKIVKNKWLKKYFKNNILLQRLSLYQFQLRMLMYKIKNHLRK